MDLQLAIAVLAVGLAGAYIGRCAWQALRKKNGCGGGCGCAKATENAKQPALIAPEQLKMRK